MLIRSWTNPLRLSAALLMISVGALTCARPVMAKEPVRVVAAEIGFNGVYKAGRWTTVRLKIAAVDGREVRGSVACRSLDGDQIPVVYRDPAGEFQLTDKEPRDVSLRLQAGSINAPVFAQFTLPSGETWSQPLELPKPDFCTRELVVQLGADIGAADLPRYVRRRAEQEYKVVTLPSAADMPRDPLAFDGVSWLILTLGRETEATKLTDDQRSAIRDWTLGGGNVVLTCAASGAAQLGPEGPWRFLLPGTFSASSRLRRTTGVDTHGGAALDVDVAAVGQAPFVLDYASTTGRVDLWEVGGGVNDRPLAVRGPVGLGQSLVIGLDLDQPPWQDWPGRGRLIAKLLQTGRHEMAEKESGGVRGQVTHLGYDDLTGQLRVALEQYRHVAFLTFTTVAAIAAIYLSLLGPLDYFLLTWLKVPKHWTWLSLGVLIAAVSGLAYMLTTRFHGRELWINQVEIVDVDLPTGTVRGTAWSHLYTPRARKCNLAWETNPHALGSPREARLTWQGLAGRGIGGLNVRTPGGGLRRPYEVAFADDGGTLAALPIVAAGSKPLSISWRGEIPPSADRLSANVYRQLSGNLTNPLPFELTEPLILFDEHLYRIPKSLAPGQTISLSSLAPLNLESRLTQRLVLEQKDMATPWDAAQLDVPRIIDMLMFHEAANGAGYTGLTHRYQPWLDLSSQLTLGRAILIGRSATPQGDLSLEGSSLAERVDQRWTWYRVSIPVAGPERMTAGVTP